jgi:hypothetical protein
MKVRASYKERKPGSYLQELEARQTISPTNAEGIQNCCTSRKKRESERPTNICEHKKNTEHSNVFNRNAIRHFFRMKDVRNRRCFGLCMPSMRRRHRRQRSQRQTHNDSKRHHRKEECCGGAIKRTKHALVHAYSMSQYVCKVKFYHKACRFNNTAFIATITVLADMNTAATAGSKIIPLNAKAPAATGSATKLYPVAQNRF